ncbi:MULTISPECIES: hypothetical protein [Asaia]|uniref:hypothetical protein n=1 Tax=Asaia TaxID=91914 RepID=UPI002555D369|nr:MULTISPECIES: hypothetical protein [Asaia]MDL2171123.1 hypothetical protein [Asaia sp. HumB]MDL2172048.1 hypothetical protein [Asaia sp. HumB]MDR6183547.1 hypothetical protein [Asaia bogorensis NBRC 16594]
MPEIREAILASKPALPPSLERPWRGWHDLQHDRAWLTDLVGAAMGKIRGVSRPGGISWQALARWCEANAVSEDDRPWIEDQIRAMDSVFMAYRNRRITEDIEQFMKG